MSDEGLPPRVRVLGLPVSATDLDGAVEAARRAVRRGAPTRIAVTNHNKCWLAARDPVLRAFLEDAEVVAAETSVRWAARVLGREGVGAAWGVALMDRLLGCGGEEGWSVYFLGAGADVVADLAALAPRRWPGIRVAGYRDGYFGEEEASGLRRRLGELRPDLLLVAMGSPRQERFLASLRAELGALGGPTVCLGVGGAFDVHAGRKADAPRWIRGSGLEWLYRAALSPRLFRRYVVVLPWFVAAVARERFTGRVPGGGE